jgi:hypothetical protein
MTKKVLLATLALVLAFALPAHAQVQAGSIHGTVFDEHGAVLAGATVTAAGGGRLFTASSDAAGRYRFLNLPPGSYDITAELPGFTTLKRESVMVTIGQSAEIPLHMRVAAIEETIVVTRESPIVDAREIGTATTFTQDELFRVPNSRDPWALLRTVPGVVLDRVNIAGNETGQQSEFVGKGTRRFDASWTLDGVVITDMAATGASPTYFDYDAFQEIHISTAGHDIRQPSGGIGLNFVVKSGTNDWHGTARGYFTNESLEWSNLPEELAARGVTAETADHNDQISDYGFDLAGPIWRDRAWFYAGWTEQDIRLIRQAGAVQDRTILRTTNVKGNWQATPGNMFSVLWFNGVKDKFGRGTGRAQFEPESARWNQGGFYPENRPRGLLKFQNDSVVTPNNFLSLKYAYYGTGFILDPVGGLGMNTTIDRFRGETVGSTSRHEFLRPQHFLNADANTFRTAWGGNHEIHYGTSYRRHDSFSRVLWPGDMVVGLIESPDDMRARVYREGAGTNRTEYFSLYGSDTIAFERLTLNLGLRYDRQWGSALPSQTQSNLAFPTLVPGIDFAGYRAPFTWNILSPRVGATYALDADRRTLLRGSYSRFAGQLDTFVVGYENPSGQVGFVEYRWEDLNGDRLVQPNEVRLDQRLAFGDGFNPDNPTAVVSANRIDPNLDPMMTDNVILGVDRELMPNLAVQAAYTYTRTSDLPEYTPWRGVGPDQYLAGPPLTGSLPDGTPYAVPTFRPDPDAVAAGGAGRFLTNYPGYRTTYHGIETSIVKRMSNRWMARLAASWNNPREFYDLAVTDLGNPTRLDTRPLVQGGQFIQRSFGSGAGDIFMNARWQVNLNGVYQLPWHNLEVAGNVFGRQGNPHPIWHAGALGVDGTQRVLVSPEIDTFRHDNLWNLDVRLAHYLRLGRASGQLTADLFNVLNASTELQRERHILSPNFNRLNQNLSPRILRLGLRLGF